MDFDLVLDLRLSLPLQCIDGGSHGVQLLGRVTDPQGARDMHSPDGRATNAADSRSSRRTTVGSLTAVLVALSLALVPLVAARVAGPDEDRASAGGDSMLPRDAGVARVRRRAPVR